MNIDFVITQIKALSTYFNGNVAGAAAHEQGVQDQVWLPPPAAYVIPLEMLLGDNSSAVGSYQTLRDRVAVICAFDNSADRRGQAGVGNIDVALKSILKAIYNWRPDSTIDNPGTFQATNPFVDHESRGFQFDGGHLLSKDLARLFWQFEFSIERTITEWDGWQYTGVPLTGIDVTFATTGTITAGDIVADITLAT